MLAPAGEARLLCGCLLATVAMFGHRYGCPSDPVPAESLAVRPLHLAVRSTVASAGVPAPAAYGVDEDGWWVQLGSESARQAWVTALRLPAAVEVWGDATVVLRRSCQWTEGGLRVCSRPVVGDALLCKGHLPVAALGDVTR